MLKSLNLKVYLLPLLILFLLLIAFTSLSKPANIYCRLCHWQQYNTWQANKHKEVDCYYCHGQPAGLAGFLKQKMDEGRMLTSAMSRLIVSRPVLGGAKDALCLNCHQQILVKEVVVRGLNVSHREFVKQTGCRDCHWQVSHQQKKQLHSINQCHRCHKQDLAAKSCDICHLKTVQLKKGK